MTILAGVVGSKYAYIATDTLITWDTGLVRDSGKGKFIPTLSEDIVVAASGECRISDIIEGLLKNEEHQHLFKTFGREQALALASLMYDYVKEAGVGTPENNSMPEHSFEALIIVKGSRKLWVIDSDYGVDCHEDYVALGSGQIVAEGAFHALDLAGIKGEKALRLAVKTAMAREPNCGGSMRMKRVSVPQTRISPVEEEPPVED